jgi:hypothetical protein
MFYVQTTFEWIDEKENYHREIKHFSCMRIDETTRMDDKGNEYDHYAMLHEDGQYTHIDVSHDELTKRREMHTFVIMNNRGKTLKIRVFGKDLFSSEANTKKK